MKFIEISEGLSISIDDIKAVEKIEELRTRIHTNISSYETELPYQSLLDIIEQRKPQEMKPETENLLQGFLKNAGTFAGR